MIPFLLMVCCLVSTISTTTTSSTTHSLDERLEYGTVGGYNYYHFNFIQRISLDTINDADCTNSYGHGFPRTIIQIIQQNPFNKIRLSFRKGRWPKVCGGSALKTTMDLRNPFTNGAAINAQGVELEATTITNTTTTTTTKDFLLLADCLSGPFCSSLSTIKDISETQDRTSDEERTFNAILPNEAVCTENLTPWIRLLPPGTPTPIKALLPKGDVLFSKPFHQLDLLITVHNGTVILEQNLLFLSVEQQQYPLPPSQQTTLLDSKHPYLLSSNIIYNDKEISKAEPITIETKILGSGLSSGIFVLMVEMLSPDADADAGAVVEIEQLLPSYIKIFMADIQLPSCVSSIRYRPGDVVTKKASQINLTISLDSLRSLGSFGFGASNVDVEGYTSVDKDDYKTITIKIPFLRSLLSSTEYPFDPARGFDIPPPRIVGGNRARKILLPLPTPDFTMPYNVITLTTTIIVLFYGTLFNLLYRSFYSRHPADSGAPLKSL